MGGKASTPFFPFSTTIAALPSKSRPCCSPCCCRPANGVDSIHRRGGLEFSGCDLFVDKLHRLYAHLRTASTTTSILSGVSSLDSC